MAHTPLKALSSFPIVAGIIYALKNDTIPDKRITTFLHQKKEWSALNVALGSSSRRHRYTALALYVLYHKWHWLPPLSWTLSWCKVIGPSSAWFEYIQQGNGRPSLRTAFSILQTIKRSQKYPEYILDIGTGIGQLPQQFPPNSNVCWVCADKNFFSLLIAQLYHPRSDILYLCADLEVQRLFRPNTFSKTVCIDCFDFIYQKDVFIGHVSEILKSAGHFIMINVHEEQRETEYWGYGIDHHAVTTLLKKSFKHISWHDMNAPEHSLRKNFSQLDTLRYSFVATK